jgi:hypothetical protein
MRERHVSDGAGESGALWLHVHSRFSISAAAPPFFYYYLFFFYSLCDVDNKIFFHGLEGFLFRPFGCLQEK